MDNQNPIDRLWRSLLSGSNQLALAHILKANLANFLELADRAKLLTLNRNDFSLIEHTRHDLAAVCPLLFGQTYGAYAADKGLTIRTLCHRLQTVGISEQLRLDQRQLDAVRRRMQDLATSASNLHHARNVNAHEHYAIDDPGFALTLAGSVLRIVEIAEIPAEQESQAERMARIADELVKSCVGIMDTDDEDENQQISRDGNASGSRNNVELLERILDRLDAMESGRTIISPQIESRRKSGTITVADLGPKYVVGQLKRMTDNMVKQINSELHTIPTADEIDSLIRAAIEDVVARDQQFAGLDEQTQKMLREIGSGINELRKAASSTDLAPALEALLDEKLIPPLSQIDELREHLNKVADLSTQRLIGTTDWSDEDRGYDVENTDEETPTTNTPPSITAKQAKTRLYLLRNRIRDEIADSGESIENWENILQGPIISEMLKKRTLSLRDWKNTSLIDEKYANHKKIMKKQLRKYGDEMFEIMNQISDWSLPKK